MSTSEWRELSNGELYVRDAGKLTLLVERQWHDRWAWSVGWDPKREVGVMAKGIVDNVLSAKSSADLAAMAIATGVLGALGIIAKART